MRFGAALYRIYRGYYIEKLCINSIILKVMEFTKMSQVEVPK